jgi:DeoR family transcriptional regulator, aga operon transcriptional repressor
VAKAIRSALSRRNDELSARPHRLGFACPMTSLPSRRTSPASLRVDAAPALAATPPGGLLMEERRRLIREQVERQGRVTVEELSARFQTSVVTIRGDLKALAEIGALVRTHGGALVHREGEELPIGVKENLHHAEKVRIAQAAAQMIRDGETILLDSGTTTAEIARCIRGLKLSGINVITNALNVAVLLANTPHARLVMLGGVLRPNSFSLSGPQAEQALHGLQADRLFLGVDSLDPEIGLMTPHVLEAQLNAQMIEAARQVIAVADSSKLQRRNLSVIAKVEQIDMLITDTGAHPATVAALRQRGVDVRLV